jgi:hypothetical protein
MCSENGVGVENKCEKEEAKNDQEGYEDDER